MTRDTATKLKIGFVLDDGLDKPDGVQQYILTLGEWFQQKGHEVRFLVGQTDRNDISGVIELSKNLKVNFNGNRLSIPVWPKLRKIKSVLEKEKFDVLHIQEPFSPVMGSRILVAAPSKTAITGTFHILPLKSSMFYKLGNKATALSIKSGLNKINKHFSVSKPAQKFAEEIYGIKSEILPNPIRINRKLPVKKDFKKQQKLTIAFLGRLVPRKGCMTLLKAIDHLDAEHKKKISVKIGGSGSQIKKLKNYVTSKKLQDIVKFYGFIAEKDKYEFLKNSDIAIFPSKGGESFGIVLTEAMASGGPIIIGGDNPGYRSVLNDDKVLFDPENYRDLSVRIAEFLSNPSTMNKIFESQQRLVRDYDINKIGERLLVNYRSMVQNKSK